MWWWGFSNAGALGNVEYSFIVIAPRSTLPRSGSTFGSNRIVWYLNSVYLSLIGIILRWGFLIWELIFLYFYFLFFLFIADFFFLILVVFVLFLLSLRFSQNHLKKARGEIWPKRSERRNNKKKLPRWGKKSAIKKKK